MANLEITTAILRLGIATATISLIALVGYWASRSGLAAETIHLFEVGR